MQETLMLIKPNSVRNKNVGEIISMVEKAGFTIKAIKVFKFDQALINKFYQEHIGKPFFKGLVDFMTSDSTFALKLHHSSEAVPKLRQLIGATDPNEREAGTIRAIFADSLSHNAVHASDSEESAIREINIIFGS